MICKKCGLEKITDEDAIAKDKEICDDCDDCKKFECTISECPFCLAFNTTHHSKDCPLMIGFDSDKDIRDIIEYWLKRKK